MTASYPSSLKVFTTPAPGDIITARSMNDIQREIEAIENTLGGDPAGTFTDVDTRLTNYENWVYKVKSNYDPYLTYYHIHFSTVSTSTAMDLTALPGSTLPATARAVNVRLVSQDTATIGSDYYYFAMGPSSTTWYWCVAYNWGGNWFNGINTIVPCTDGVVWYQVKASGTDTLGIYMEVWGYWEELS